MTDKPYQERLGGSYARKSKDAKPSLVERTRSAPDGAAAAKPAAAGAEAGDAGKTAPAAAAAKRS
jgi:hypothetical protein